MSNLNEAVKMAFNKNYRVTDSGEVIGPSGRIRKLSVQSTNHGNTKYLSFSVPRAGQQNVRMPVHKPQAFQKFGDVMFEPGTEVRHRNGDSVDNSKDNIEIGCARDNAQDQKSETYTGVNKDSLWKAIHRPKRIFKRIDKESVEALMRQGLKDARQVADALGTDIGGLHSVMNKIRLKKIAGPRL